MASSAAPDEEIDRAKALAFPVCMKPGMGSLLFGIALLLLGIGVTVSSGQVVWYGAILVGIYRIIRGLITLSASSQGPQG